MAGEPLQWVVGDPVGGNGHVLHLDRPCRDCRWPYAVQRPEWRAWWAAHPEPPPKGESPSGTPCERCGGSGFELTLVGEVLRTFVERHCAGSGAGES